MKSFYYYFRFLSIGSVVLLLSVISFAEVMTYPFDNELQEIRFKSLLEELRCPKCQNQSLADSDADIAKDLRQKIYDLLLDGKSDEEIRNYLVERYGDFINYRPPLKSSTFLLWLGPLFLLCISIGLAIIKVMSKARQNPVQNNQAHEVDRL